PHEPGPHGCTIISVDDRGTARLDPINCDVIRWISPRVSLSEGADENELETALHDRARKLAEENSGVALLVDWKIDCGEPLRRALRHGLLARTFELKLRDEFGRGQPPVWTARIDAELPERMSQAWRDEETIRGDFLRLVDGYRNHSPPIAELSSL